MVITWKPVPKTVLVTGVAAAVLFWVHALTARSGFLILDYANLPVHEAGHLLFGVFGPTLGLWGGTLMQLLMPLAFLAYFVRRGETTGASFAAFWFGENCLYSATYIADARTMLLPLVGGGEHDWNLILSRLHLLGSEAGIAGAVRFLGWVIMVLAVVFLVSHRERKDAGDASAARARAGQASKGGLP
jgi:hypothetical protein